MNFDAEKIVKDVEQDLSSYYFHFKKHDVNDCFVFESNCLSSEFKKNASFRIIFRKVYNSDYIPVGVGVVIPDISDMLYAEKQLKAYASKHALFHYKIANSTTISFTFETYKKKKLTSEYIAAKEIADDISSVIWHTELRNIAKYAVNKN